jgi:hypothetical protein
LFVAREYVVKFTDGTSDTLQMSLLSARMHKLTLKGTNINPSTKSRITGPVILLSKLLMGSQPVAMAIVSMMITAASLHQTSNLG